MKESEEQITNTTIELSVSVKRFDSAKKELVDSIEANTKLTKADAGREDKPGEDWFTLRVEPTINTDGSFGIPRAESNFHSKDLPTGLANGA
jgi:hypothetical protein